MDFLALITVVATILFLSIFIYIEKSWLTPVSIFTGFWIIHILLFWLYLKIIDYRIDSFFASSLLIMLFGFLSMGLGSLVGRYFTKNSVFFRCKVVHQKQLQNELIFLISLVFVLLIIIFNMQGKLLPTTIDMEALSSSITSARYGNHIAEPIVNPKVFMVISFFTYFLVYYTNLLGGRLFVVSTSYLPKIISILPLLVAFLAGAYNRGSRMGILIAIGLWLASLFANAILLKGLNRGKQPSFAKIFLILAIIGVLGILLSGFVTLARYGEISSIALVDAILSIADYPGGFFAFSQIIEDSLITDIDLRLGYHTLYRIFYFLGVTNSNIVVDVGFTSTNYLTIFGELIIDFGVLGLMLFFFFFGTIGGYSYKKVKNGDVRFVGILATIYSYIFMSATFSVFSFMTTLTALIFFSYINFKKCYYPEDSR